MKEVKKDTHFKIITAANNVFLTVAKQPSKAVPGALLGCTKAYNNFYRHCRSCETIPRSYL